MTDDWRGIQFTNRPYNEYERETMNTQGILCYFGEIGELKGSIVYKWTTEPPTQAGWYWAVFDGKIKLFQLIFNKYNCLYINNTWENTNLVTHWLGPLPEPEMPK